MIVFGVFLLGNIDQRAAQLDQQFTDAVDLATQPQADIGGDPGRCASGRCGRRLPASPMSAVSRASNVSGGTSFQVEFSTRIRRGSISPRILRHALLGWPENPHRR